MNDYSGQGTALVGPLNVFWREKGYVNAQQWREFCSPVVVMAKFPKFVYANTDTLRVGVEAYNGYGQKFRPSQTHYTLTTQGGDTLVHQLLANRPIPLGKNIEIGTITFPLTSITVPTQCTLTLNVENVVFNHYDFWVYPQPTPQQEKGKDDIYITDTLDSHALKVLKKGGRVLLTAAGHITYGSDIKQTYLPVFWNTSWFKMRPPHTTGAYIDTTHPLFRNFPTDNWANLQWWELLNRAQVINLSRMPADYQSPIQPIDTWHLSRKLGMVLEANVLKGKLLLTTMDITTNLDHRLAARQMRHAILIYMQSDAFVPTLTLAPENIQSLFTDTAPPVNMFTKDSPDELKPKIQN